MRGLTPEELISESEVRQNESVVEAMRKHALREYRREDNRRLRNATLGAVGLILLVLAGIIIAAGFGG
jgi:hypothetical protein